MIHRHTNQARKDNWDAHQRIFKLIAIMKEVYSATLLYCTSYISQKCPGTCTSGNHDIARTIKDLHYKWYLKIVPKLHEPLGECNLAWFSNITSSVILNCTSNIIWLLVYYIHDKNDVCQPLPNANNSGHHMMIVTDWRTHVYNFIMTVHSWMCQDYIVCLWVNH